MILASKSLMKSKLLQTVLLSKSSSLSISSPRILSTSADFIMERHRHRYEVNIAYRDQLADAGMVMSGLSPDGSLPEIVERADHPFFVAVQFHPELKSKPFEPHPLFTGFVAASMEKSRLV